MITTTHQTTRVDAVEKIVVTEPVLDPDSGDFIREIRVLTGPEGEEGMPVFVLRLAGAERAKIELTAPEQTF